MGELYAIQSVPQQTFKRNKDQVHIHRYKPYLGSTTDPISANHEQVIVT